MVVHSWLYHFIISDKNLISGYSWASRNSSCSSTSCWWTACDSIDPGYTACTTFRWWSQCQSFGSVSTGKNFSQTYQPLRSKRNIDRRESNALVGLFILFFWCQGLPNMGGSNASAGTLDFLRNSQQVQKMLSWKWFFYQEVVLL